ncbi:hypothetical protein C8R46DRAFT_1189638 [Mycena filopes]|nr:hypothetical protein C8R46DRAFT_1189638 [Mycena filopes]
MRSLLLAPPKPRLAPHLARRHGRCSCHPSSLDTPRPQRCDGRHNLRAAVELYLLPGYHYPFKLVATSFRLRGTNDDDFKGGIQHACGPLCCRWSPRFLRFLSDLEHFDCSDSAAPGSASRTPKTLTMLPPSRPPASILSSNNLTWNVTYLRRKNPSQYRANNLDLYVKNIQRGVGPDRGVLASVTHLRCDANATLFPNHHHLVRQNSKMDTSGSKASSDAKEFSGGNLTPAVGTRHHELLNSNETPLDSEILLIKSTTSQIDARMIAIDEEIALLHRRLQQLTDERQSLIRLRSRNSAIVSQLRRFPPEVLAEIFTWTLPAVWSLSGHRFSSENSPWFLTHVSHRWRAIAISTSSLWSLVVIDYPRNPAGLYPLPMLETHIGRAQKLKVDFCGDEARDPVSQIEVFNYLASHSPRWEELSLTLTSALVPLLGSLQDRIPSLCRLYIEWSNEDSQSNVDSLDCFQRAPCLVDFAVYNEFRPVPIRLPVQQLTAYRADHPWDVHQGVIGLAVSLVELRIVIDFDDNPRPNVKETYHLPCLRRLYVSHPVLLGFLTAPSLEELALNYWPDNGTEMQRSFGPFVERSGCTLKRLCLDGYVKAATLSRMLKDTTSITELVIIKSVVSGAEIDEAALLHMLMETPNVAPQLQSISLGCHLGRSPNHRLCLQMISSRWRQPHRALRAAALLSPDALAPHHTLDVLNMRQEGLDLLVLDGPAAKRIMNDWTYHQSWN